ncbi:hypothetical protein ACS0TY_022070 [Phlomoides rotata]
MVGGIMIFGRKGTEVGGQALCRVFKIKLDRMIKDLKDNMIFGKVDAMTYTVEFQKRGLPHAHRILFLSRENKIPNLDDVDRIISAEIPNKERHSKLHELVSNYMIHGPCGVLNYSSQCMEKNKCTKKFLKKYRALTSVDEDGYPLYNRRDDGDTIEKK